MVSSVPIIDLVRTGVGMGAYMHGKGWSHDRPCRLAERFGAKAFPKGNLSTDDLRRFLDIGRLPIASIRWAFRDVKTARDRLLFWKRFGWHPTLLPGYDESGFIVHHTLIRKEYNWEAKHSPFAEFERGFTGRAVMIGR